LTSPANLILVVANPALRCPACLAGSFSAKNDTLVCKKCAQGYPFDRETGVAALTAPSSNSAIKRDIRAWWGDLYRQLYASDDAQWTSESLLRAIDDLEELFQKRRHLAAVEMPLDDLRGRAVLEIGCGGGGHSALFARKGANVTAVDITPERAASAALKFSLLPSAQGVAYQADAENLPFHDNTFDIVYSNGVLHHSENTESTLAEVRRVLKPGGRAILMLYSRHSATFWCNILPQGLLNGSAFHLPEGQWIGRITEGTPKHGDTRNPITRVYSFRELRTLLKDFRIVSLRKSSFQLDNFAIPRLTQIREWALRQLGRPAHPGGILVYGRPFIPETSLELALGRYIGFAWNIVVEKS